MSNQCPFLKVLSVPYTVLIASDTNYRYINNVASFPVQHDLYTHVPGLDSDQYRSENKR